ncbi:MAG TPA: flagellar biosynthetic protein FliR [Phycisphaerae bacterium]|nr:flagellar biosynthetic protein FliR [Phycisphaerae bacterium]HPM23177.1 flagellar biosynthetic protein FliR [Phycisphaerae bacterium]
MPFELLAQYLKLPVFGLVAARLGGLIMFQPLLGTLSVPVRLRLMFVLGLAALMTPLVHLPGDAPDTPLTVALALGSEVLLGALIGLVTVGCFLGLQYGGLLVAQESGLAFGQIADPTSEDEETVPGVFYLQLGAVVYLIIGGHRALLCTCLDTFETIPLLADRPYAVFGTELLCQALTLSGEVAFRVAGPALLALFLVNLALGFISRTMPQLNILAVGFSLKALIAFVVMAIALPTATDAFVSVFERGYRWFNELIGVPG